MFSRRKLTDRFCSTICYPSEVFFFFVLRLNEMKYRENETRIYKRCLMTLEKRSKRQTIRWFQVQNGDVSVSFVTISLDVESGQREQFRLWSFAFFDEEFYRSVSTSSFFKTTFFLFVLEIQSFYLFLLFSTWSRVN